MEIRFISNIISIYYPAKRVTESAGLNAEWIIVLHVSINTHFLKTIKLCKHSKFSIP